MPSNGQLGTSHNTSRGAGPPAAGPYLDPPSSASSIAAVCASSSPRDPSSDNGGSRPSEWRIPRLRGPAGAGTPPAGAGEVRERTPPPAVSAGGGAGSGSPGGRAVLGSGEDWGAAPATTDGRAGPGVALTTAGMASFLAAATLTTRCLLTIPAARTSPPPRRAGRRRLPRPTMTPRVGLGRPATARPGPSPTAPPTAPAAPAARSASSTSRFVSPQHLHLRLAHRTSALGRDRRARPALRLSA
eukprot:scaffold12918_cov98-Isochrysis_galbana.AAC.2